MANSSLRSFVLAAAIIAAGFAAVVYLSDFNKRSRPELPDEITDSDLDLQGARLKGFVFGTEGLIADWYWMRSLQYIGDKLLKRPDDFINIDDLRDLNPRLLYPMLDNATDLDPHFIAAYSYGAVIMPAIDKEKAIKLVEKGIANNPDSWRLYQHLAYIYWKIGRYDKAAETYEKGSEIVGAAPFMKLMAASMKTEGGSRETARSIYRLMLDSDDEQVKITAERRLKELDWLDEQEAIDRILAEFKAQNGRCVNAFNEIASALLRTPLPGNRHFKIDKDKRLVDPTDAPYLLDKENCRVKLDSEKTQLPVK